MNKKHQPQSEEKIRTYADVLQEAIEDIVVIETEMIQYPKKENLHNAVFKATIRTAYKTFNAYADANPANVEKKFHPFLLQVAETRAKGRAIRDLLGIGAAIIEEYEDIVLADAKTTRQQETQKNADKQAEKVKDLVTKEKPKDVK